MKLNLVLCFAAAFGLAVANVHAQDVVETAVPAPAVDASQTIIQPLDDCCEDCAPGFGLGGRLGGRLGGAHVAYGDGFGFGYGGAFDGRYGGGFVGAPAAGFRARAGQRAAERNDRIGRQRQIVQASPYAVPTGEMQDWARFRNYPYGYYPHNFGTHDMSIPGYNPAWQNYYPAPRRFHEGKHFHLDVF